MKILGTGLSGLVGSRIVELLIPDFSFQNLSLDTGVDITNKGLIDKYISESDAPWVFHFAAVTDVDACEREKDLKEKSTAWKVNVAATENIVSACQRTGKRLLYVSTDFVFDGTKQEYTEEDEPHPLNWYAMTKYAGEKLVSTLGRQGLIIRIANPFRAKNGEKKDFVHRIMDKLGKRETFYSPDDQIFVPTLVDDIAAATKKLIQSEASGVYHVVGSQALTPFASAQKIADVFGFDGNLVQPTSFAKYFRGRAPRPFQLNIRNDKIAKSGIKMSTFDEGLASIKTQI